jgi:PAS domain S-box-containing protein
MDNDWTILIIDDEEGIRKLLAVSLADLGYRVLTATDGWAGLRLCKDEGPQIIIADIRIPGLDGIEVLRRIKQEHPEKQVIVITGHEDVDIAIRALQLRASDYIPKPINHDALVVVVERARERYTTWKALHASEEKYSDLVEGSLTGIYIDLDGRIVFANRKFGEIYGYSKDEIIGMESGRLVHPDDRPMVSSIRRRRLAGEDAPAEYVARGFTKEGKTIWIVRRNTRIAYQGRPAILGNIVDVTETKRDREALEESEEKYRALSEALTLGLREVFDALREMASGNPRVHIEEASAVGLIAELKRLVNHTAENLAEIVDLSHEFAIGLAEHFDVLNRVSTGDLAARVKGNSGVELLEALKVLTNRTIENVSREIGERKRAEKAVRESEEKYRRLAKALTLGLAEVFDALNEIAAGDPLVRVDESSELELMAELKRMVNITAQNLGEIVDLSHEFAIGLAEHFDVLHRVSKGDLSARVMGTSQVELLESLTDITNRMIQSVAREIADRKRAEDAVQKAHGELELRVFERTAELTAANARLMHEVEERKRAEGRVRTSEEKYRLLFDYDPNLLLVVDVESGKILDVNTAAMMIYGYNRRQLFDMPFWKLFEPDEAARLRREFRTVAGQEYIFIPRVRTKKSDGSGFFIDLHARGTLAEDQDGVLAGTLIVRMVDITRRLERDAKLIQASKMATLGEMATGIAHELNQPLNVIQVGTDFFSKMAERRRPIPEEHMRKACRNIREQIDRATRIINHLREFGRKSDFEIYPVNLNEPIRDVFTILGQQLQLRKIEVSLSLEEKPLLILADKNRLEQIFLNLITNARDAMEGKGTGAKVLSISTRREGDRAVAIVSDTGTGMSKAVQERIFEPFFTTKEVGKGTGLGLSISYNLVKDFNGHIEVESTEGVGTAFEVSFPAYHPPQGAR